VNIRRLQIRANIYLPNPACDGRLEQSDDIPSRHSEALWWLMHHSDKPDRRSAVITCYLDDSDSEQFGFIGGIVMTKEQYDKLNNARNLLLRKYRLECVHMQDFVRPQGRYVGMHRELKLSLFKDIASFTRR
jgi:hypothetical protein